MLVTFHNRLIVLNYKFSSLSLFRFCFRFSALTYLFFFYSADGVSFLLLSILCFAKKVRTNFLFLGFSLELTPTFCPLYPHFFLRGCKVLTPPHPRSVRGEAVKPPPRPPGVVFSAGGGNFGKPPPTQGYHCNPFESLFLITLYPIGCVGFQQKSARGTIGTPVIYRFQKSYFLNFIYRVVQVLSRVRWATHRFFDTPSRLPLRGLYLGRGGAKSIFDYRGGKYSPFPSTLWQISQNNQISVFIPIGLFLGFSHLFH